MSYGNLSRDEDEELSTILLEIAESGYEFDVRAAEFIGQTCTRYERYGKRTQLTDRQWSWLRALHQKANGQ